jgi:hypothetical protein
MNSSPATRTWCCFQNIPSGPEAASAAASCAFSLSTLEVASTPDAATFAVTERKQPEIWRWAIICGGCVLEEGFEPTREDAKNAATEALEMIRNQASNDGTS